MGGEGNPTDGVKVLDSPATGWGTAALCLQNRDLWSEQMKGKLWDTGQQGSA